MRNKNCLFLNLPEILGNPISPLQASTWPLGDTGGKAGLPGILASANLLNIY